MNYKQHIRDRRKRIKSELRLTKPIAFVLGGERFIVSPPAALLSFQAIVTVEDDFQPLPIDFREAKRDRWALLVGDRVLAVTKPDGNSHLIRSVPGDDYTLELSAAVTRTRCGFRRYLLPEAKLIGTTKNGTQFKV